MLARSARSLPACTWGTQFHKKNLPFFFLFSFFLSFFFLFPLFFLSFCDFWLSLVTFLVHFPKYTLNYGTWRVRNELRAQRAKIFRIFLSILLKFYVNASNFTGLYVDFTLNLVNYIGFLLICSLRSQIYITFFPDWYLHKIF